MGPVELRRLGSTLNGLMVMSPEFRYDTARLFLTMFGRSRNIRRELSADPLALLAVDPVARAAVQELVGVLGR
jgi:phytoene dehydrogenase-like protein